VTLKCRSLDRISLQGYVPELQIVGQACIFLRWQRGSKIPSSAALGQISSPPLTAPVKLRRLKLDRTVNFVRA
jgi:hypothetical protein